MRMVVGNLMRLLSLVSCWAAVQAFSTTLQNTNPPSRALFDSSFSTTALSMASRTRGLEQRREGAAPMEGGMTLYLKAAEDGSSVGDCPFAHAVRLVLEEKQLEYDVQPCAPDSKPEWLEELYEGKMPALRHRKECYVESSVISEYLDFFFRTPSLKAKGVENEEVLEGFFPAVAQYLKDVDDTEEKLDQLKVKLSSLDEHLKDREFVCGDQFTLLDCRLLPQLYHLQVGSEGFKKGIPSLETDEYPHLSKYYQLASQRPSFQTTVYPPETVLWGWGNARN